MEDPPEGLGVQHVGEGQAGGLKERFGHHRESALVTERSAYPIALDETVTLTPFAAGMRYDYLPPEEGADESFDRAHALQLAGLALKWAEDLIAPS